jgi:oligosaccharide 4-alpha-D-glucosyltransferase
MRTFLLFSLLIICVSINAQVVWINPSDATVDSTITVYFDATQGDQGLMDYTENVYAHTGVITSESVSDSDWKYVVSDWGTDDPNVLMTRLEANLYSLTYHIRSFYGIAADETVLKLAFVFRSADGSVTGRNANGSDVIIPLQMNSDWEYQSYSNSNDGLTIQTNGGQILLREYQQGIETEILPTGNISETSYAIAANPIESAFDINESDNKITAQGENMQVIIQKAPLKIHYIKNDTITSLKSFFTSNDNQGGLLTLYMEPNAKLYGGGSRAIPYNLRGYTLDLYNQAHYGYSNFTNNLNVSIPVFVSSSKVAWIFDNHHPGQIIASAEGLTDLSYQSTGGNLRFLVTSGEDFQAVSSNVAELTGKAPLPPLWAMGFIQSRYGYETQTEAETVVTDMRAANFPLDALVLDLYWFGGTNRMGDFDWDLASFPNPEQMITEFKNQGVETILITEPYFTLESDHYSTIASLGYFAQQSNGDPFVLWGFWAGDASLFDMSSQQARDWLWPKYESLLNQDIGGLWTDLGEPETHPAEMIHAGGSAHEVHNIHNNLWAKMLYENFESTYTNRRMFNLTRSGYTGMQRYGTYPWSGDIQRSFEGLQAQIPIMLHMSMSGIGYMHSDLGGFTGGGQNSELYTRWLQLGAFSPIMRAHGTGVPSEPIFYDSQTQDYVREAINLRYNFLPYNYTLAWEYSTMGTPLARPMNYYSSNASELDELDDQFLWGKDVLVAPVLSEGVTSRLVYLPNGKWANYANGEIYNGNSTITASAPISNIPVYLRQGGFVVESSEKLLTTQSFESDSIRINHFVCSNGQNSSSNWYYDDGVNPSNLVNNNYDLMKLSGSTNPTYTDIKLETTENNYISPERYVEFKIYGLSENPEQISINSTPLGVTTSQATYEQATTGAFWNGTFLYVHFNWKDTTVNIQINKDSSGLDNLADDNTKILIAPNPVQRNSYIEIIADRTAKYEFQIINMSGKIINKTLLYIHFGKQTIPLSAISRVLHTLNSGVYILQVQSGNYRETTRLVKTD